MAMNEQEPLSVGEIFELVAVVDSERERVKQLIVDNPRASADNNERRNYIKKLDTLSKRLTLQIEKSSPSFKICSTCKARNLVNASECYSCHSQKFGEIVKFKATDQELF